MTDSEWAAISRARDGDSEAFRLLVDWHSRPVFRLAFRMTGNAQDAEDVVQETFLRAYRKLKSFEERANFGTWLYRIAANCSVDCIRKRKRHIHYNDAIEGGSAAPAAPSAGDSSSTQDSVVFGVELRQRVEQAMTTLSQLERQAFVLRHFEGLSIREISGTLGMPASSAKQSIFRAVQKMRRALQPMVGSTS